MTNSSSPESHQDREEELLGAMTRLLRQMAWTWIGYLLFVASFGILFIISSPELIDLMGISQTHLYFSLLAPLCVWSFVSRYMFEVARGLEKDFNRWQRRAKIIGVIAGTLLGPPLLSYQAWYLLKKLKQYAQSVERLTD